MRAVVIEEFGGVEKLKMADVPTPQAAPGEILIQIHYAAVNPVDWKIREGYLRDALPHKFPIIPGWDAAGVVREVGPDTATEFRPGDRVYAYCRKPEVQMGTYAEYVAVAAEVVARAPRNISLAAAAGVPLVGLTAWQALFEFAQLTAGQSVLVHAGAGGVGGMAIQMAKAAGARVLTTASRGNGEYVKSLGADVVIDYRSESFSERALAEVPEKLDMVLDCVGGETLNRSYDLVRPGGALVSIVDTPDEQRARQAGIRATYVFVRPDGDQLNELTAWIEAEKLRPLPVEEMPLEQAVDAQVKNQERHQRGKLVLRVEE